LLVPHVYDFSSNSAEQFAEQTENEKPQSVGIKGKIKNWD